MSYIGSQPSYGAFEKQFFTGDGTNTVYNLDHIVNSAASLLVSVNGVILLSFYSMGLAVPFIIVGLMMSKLLIMTSFLNKYIRYFQFITGVILLITGVLIFNGSIQSLGFQLNSILPSLEMLLI